MSTRPSTPAASWLPRPPVADEAGRVRVVDHDERAVLLGQVADAGQRRDHAVHREHAVGHDELAPRAGGLDQARLELVEVAVGVAEALRLAEPDAVDDARVVEGVGDHRVLGPEQGLEQPAVGVEARAVEDRVLRAEKLGQPRLELLVQRLGAADEAHGRHAVAPAVERRVRGLHDRRVVGEAEVVVGAQVDRLRAALERDLGGLRRGDRALVLVEPGFADPVDLRPQIAGQGLTRASSRSPSGSPDSELARVIRCPTAAPPSPSCRRAPPRTPPRGRRR